MATKAEKADQRLAEKKALGIVQKFHVTRTDGKHRAGQKHHDCEYFVLDLTHDPFSVPAIRAYADACDRQGYHQLAFDLRRRALELEAALGCNRAGNPAGTRGEQL